MHINRERLYQSSSSKQLEFRFAEDIHDIIKRSAANDVHYLDKELIDQRFQIMDLGKCLSVIIQLIITNIIVEKTKTIKLITFSNIVKSMIFA
jgi:gluconate kinase